MEDKKSKVGLYDDCFNEYIFRAVKNDSACLDVGCWTGNVGGALFEKKGCVVDGVDNCREALEKAKKRGYTNIFEINLNEPDFSLPTEKKYDFIICADVLEHLIDPGHVLRKLGGLLGDRGEILISVPNVAFVQQRLALLAGRFSYSSAGGIMDENHLRFFTLGNIRKLCRKAGYEVVESYGYAQVKKKFYFLKPLAAIWPQMFALQFFLRIKKK